MSLIPLSTISFSFFGKKKKKDAATIGAIGFVSQSTLVFQYEIKNPFRVSNSERVS